MRATPRTAGKSGQFSKLKSGSNSPQFTVKPQQQQQRQQQQQQQQQHTFFRKLEGQFNLSWHSLTLAVFDVLVTPLQIVQLARKSSTQHPTGVRCRMKLRGVAQFSTPTGSS